MNKNRVVQTASGKDADGDSKSMLSEILKEIKDLKKQGEDFRTEIRNKISGINEKLETVDEKVKTMQSALETNIKTLESDVERLTKEMDKKTAGLEHRIKYLEEMEERRVKQEKKNNVIIKVKETQPDNADKTRELTENIMKQIGVSRKIVNSYFIGQDTKGWGLIKVQMSSFDEKMEIMRNKRKLRGQEIFIENDMTRQEREIQAAIRFRAKQERERGNSVRIGYQRLQINGTWENWGNPKN